uniref:Peptidase S1 domain-containing protein n=1 Tax=Caenorhabditis tropicalis TaxID=1561998 RepID=A0A1I7T717_9PELO
MIYTFNSKAVDSVDITGFSRCGLTSKWFRTQFTPFLTKFSEIPRGLNITYHPLSIGSEVLNKSKVATCENGWIECQLNKIQCCSKKYMKDEPKQITVLKVLTCIQGKGKVEDGIACLPNNKQKQIQACYQSEDGEKLLLSEPFPHNDSIVLPWIKINGVRSYEATKNFQKVICTLESVKNAAACTNK